MVKYENKNYSNEKHEKKLDMITDINNDNKKIENPKPTKREIDGLSRKERRMQRNIDYSKTSKNNKKGFHKLNNDEVLEKFNFNFSRDAEWYKKTNDKIEEIKDDLDKKFYSPEKKKEKIEFIRKLKDKLKDYRDAINFAEKYKKVKFVERRKLERMLTKANKEIKSMEEEIKKEIESDPNKNILDMKIQLNDNIMKRDKIVQNINYVKYFPKSYKYLSLFPKNDQDNEETKKKIEKIRSKIDFGLNKTTKNKKMIEKKIQSISKNKDKEESEDIEMKDEEEKEIENEISKTKIEKNSNISTSDFNNKKGKIENYDRKKDKKDKKIKDIKSTYDYELEVLNNNEIENDDFFILE